MSTFDESKVKRSKGRFDSQNKGTADIDTSALTAPNYANDRAVNDAIEKNIRQRYSGIKGSFSGSYEANYSRIVNKGFRYEQDGSITQKVSDSDLNALIDDNTRFYNDEGEDEERF